MSARARLPFVDLHPDNDADAVNAAIARVVASGWYVLGPEVEQFETEFAAVCGAQFAAGDDVLVPAMTAAYTAFAVIAAGARPVIVDVEAATLTIDPDRCVAAVTSRTRAIVPVHLYGQPAEMTRIRQLAQRHALAIVEDCCQAHLATENGIPVGTRADAAAFSFYPTKNLGALGDGGAVVTNNAAVADRVRRLRNGGQTTRYQHLEAAGHSRLDELQAAVLRARLPFLARWTARRRELAALYRRTLPDSVLPIGERDPGHVYHLFPVRAAERDLLQSHLAAAGIETLVHYPVPLTEQPAFASYDLPACPVATEASRALLSLPLYPRLADADAETVAREVGVFLKGSQPA